MKQISVHLKINKEDILNELTKRTSYTVLALTNKDNATQERWSDKIVLSSDEYASCQSGMQQAFYALRNVLFPYSAPIDGAFDDNGENYSFRLLLSSNGGRDMASVIKNYLKEAMVNYLLAEWFSERIPEKSAYLQSQYTALLGLIRVSLSRRQKAVRRPTTFF